MFLKTMQDFVAYIFSASSKFNSLKLQNLFQDMDSDNLRTSANRLLAAVSI